MLIAVDLETECTVAGCPDHGKSICRNDHSLSPWHSRITVIGAVTEKGHKSVFRDRPGAAAHTQLAHWIDDHFYKGPVPKLIGHNFKFDFLHLNARGANIPLEWWHGCTQLMAYTLTDKIPDSWLEDYVRNAPPGTRKAGKHSLKTLAPYFLGVEPYWESRFAQHGHDSDDYVLADVEYTLRLYKELSERLAANGQLEFCQTRLLPWAKLLLEAELHGVKLDMAGLAEMETILQSRSVILKDRLDEVWADAHRAYRQQLATELNEKYQAMAMKAAERAKDKTKTLMRYKALYDAAAAKLPAGVDYDSPKQMAWLLRDFKGYDITSYEGEETTGREVLERLAEEGRDDVKTYLEWRKTNKILTAFLPTYRSLQVDGVLHPVYNPDSTRTGRTSSERPNMQQVPPALRKLIKARDGYCYVGYDAGAIEAKLIALYSEDPTLYGIISSGASLHDYNTKLYFGLEEPTEEIKGKYPVHRQATKNVGFALFYGAGSNRIRVTMAQKGFHFSQSECKAIHERFKKSYASAVEYSRNVVNAMEQGEVIENLLGRPLKVQNPEDAYMTAFNMLIQSSASDLILHGALRAKGELAAAGIEAHPVLFVHDYVCFEVKREHAVEADAIVQRALTDFDLNTAHGPVALTVEGGISDHMKE